MKWHALTQTQITKLIAYAEQIQPGYSEHEVVLRIVQALDEFKASKQIPQTEIFQPGTPAVSGESTVDNTLMLEPVTQANIEYEVPPSSIYDPVKLRLVIDPVIMPTDS